MSHSRDLPVRQPSPRPPGRLLLPAPLWQRANLLPRQLSDRTGLRTRAGPVRQLELHRRVPQVCHLVLTLRSPASPTCRGAVTAGRM